MSPSSTARSMPRGSRKRRKRCSSRKRRKKKKPRTEKYPMAATDAKFFRSMKRRSLLVNQGGAGAGVTGLVGFAGLMTVAGVFFVTENYFIASLVVSIALLIYVTGTDVGRVFLSSFTIFFSSRHLIPKAAYLQDTLAALKETLNFARDNKGEI